MPTAEQVDLADAIGRIVMAWIAFLVTIVVTLFFLGFLVYCILKHEDKAVNIVLTVVNVFLLQLLTIIYRSIFTQKNPKTRT